MASKSMIIRTILFLHMILGKSLPKIRHSHATQTKLFKHHHDHFLPAAADLDTATMVCDFEGTLLRSSSTFPYFMLVALEAGSFLRGLLLLIFYPFACLLGKEKGLELMVMVSFFGIRANGSKIGRTVLLKHLSEAMGMEGFEFVMRINRGGKRRVVCVSEMPKVMVEEFVKEYLGIEMVVGRKLKEKFGYYTGFMEEYCDDYNWRKELFGDGHENVVGVIGGSRKCLMEHPIFTKCKRTYTISEDKKRSWHRLPRHNHRKPLVFHDGRIAFRPTPLASLAMFIWLPFGFLLANFRIIIFTFLPYKLSIPCLALTGMKSRLIVIDNNTSSINKLIQTTSKHVYVCNHKTLLDPIYVSAALRKPVTAVTYSLSRLSELLSPIKTIRLTRDHEEDRRRMEAQGDDIVVCPEGTTCREPFLLRFSPLFTELNKEVVPVALDVRVDMFHGTTAAGFKCMDPFFFLINPCPCYSVEFLDKISISSTSSSDRFEVANFVQAQIGRALGFQCTNFTRKGKYLKLAGNQGLVNNN